MRFFIHIHGIPAPGVWRPHASESYQSMDRSNDPRKWRGNAPVPYYAIVIGVLVIVGLIFAVQYGRAKQNVISSGAPTSAPSAR